VNYWTDEDGKSTRTAQAYVVAIEGFARWLKRLGELSSNPLDSDSMPALNPKLDPRRERRMLLPDEWHWLLDAKIDGPERGQVTGRERALLYTTAIQTGLRSNELRKLTRGRLYFGAIPPYAVCKAGTTKNKKDAKQYLLPALAANLLTHVATKAPQAADFKMPSKFEMAEVVRADLTDVRRTWLEVAKNDPDERLCREDSDFLCDISHEGERLDFHSLRHTFGAWVPMTGAYPKVLQTVMRHLTITLTMDTYLHLLPGQAADAVSRVTGFFRKLDGAENGQSISTGADGKRDLYQEVAQHPGSESSRVLASGSDGTSETAAQPTCHNVLPVANLGATLRARVESSEMRLLGLESKTYGLKVLRPCTLSRKNHRIRCAMGALSASGALWAEDQVRTSGKRNTLGTARLMVPDIGSANIRSILPRREKNTERGTCPRASATTFMLS
jgi:integrase